ncbi:hypothetical protein MEG05_15725 [Vibrio aestuarianus]|uniref:hypothetical protein n=1 Tax=Vibrio aestuarianus TaxID=28171 RepID=UPI00237C8A3C|nr:hypothetical protein [Vibrio aestuarianus]MDE1315507.1 hypothetical protein [Vibrio aestuarianus]
MNTAKSQWKQKSQAPSLRGGLAFVVFQTVTRQRNHLMNDCSIAPTIETKWLNCRKDASPNVVRQFLNSLLLL